DVTLANNLPGFNYIKVVGILNIDSYTASTQYFILGSGGIFNNNTGVLEISQTTKPTIDGTFNGNTGTVYYNSTTNLLVNEDPTYYTLKVRENNGYTAHIGDAGAVKCTNLEITNPGTAGGTGHLHGNIDIGGNVTIGSGTTLQPNYNINLAGNFANSGTFTAGSNTVTFDGSSAQAISGSSTTTFNNLTNNNSSTGITLNSAITVTNNLTLTDGDVDLNGNNIDLSSTGTIVSETNDKRIKGTTGVITTTRTINAPSSLDVGGMGVILTGPDNLGSTTIQRGHTPQSGAGNTGIERYYDISPTNNSGLDMTLRFNYYSNEQAGQSEGDFTLWRSTDGGSTWTNKVGTLDTGSDYIELASITAFSRWTVSNSVTDPLPIELLSFSAEVEGNGVRLKWETASEINNDYFTIERSDNGIDFEILTIVEGAGNSNQLLSYEAFDENPYKGISYYRLKQTDYDGKWEYFPMVSVTFMPDEFEIVEMLPNPTDNSTTIYFTANENETVILKVYNTNGQEVFSKSILTTKGVNEIYLDAAGLTKGMYLICLENQSRHQRVQAKLVKCANLRTRF
ncbi:T9SS type A sorting domain-containing protein, partial [Candidatus Amoebophilus asiaticus]|nr:T9SS type A sorting domain-containing protein [Candidatus Amoebophilus asiaticus]